MRADHEKGSRVKDKVTTALSNERTEALAKFCAANRGALPILLQALSKRTRKEWNRENLKRWLHHDPKQRTQPLFGVGLILLEEGELIMKLYGPAEGVARIRKENK